MSQWAKTGPCIGKQVVFVGDQFIKTEQCLEIPFVVQKFVTRFFFGEHGGDRAQKCRTTCSHENDEIGATVFKILMICC